MGAVFRSILVPLGYGRRVASSDPARPLLLSRRSALLALLGLPIALAGCTRDGPPVQDPLAQRPNTAPSTAASPTPSSAQTPAGTSQAAAIELALADLAGATLVGRQRTELTRAQRDLLAAVRAGHLDHLAALRSPEPTSMPAPTSTASPRRGSLAPKKAIAALIKQERSAAGRHARTALASTGFDALLWASMSVAASSYATALAASKAHTAETFPRNQLPELSETDAVTELVGQIHALVYGYQLAIGRLPVLSKAHARAVTELRRIRVLRDRLIAILTARSAEVPVSNAAYVPSVRVHDAGSAGELIERMQSALLPYCGLFLASAASPSNRKLAFDILARTASTARSWGAPLTAWPGWP
jgi:Domain of unknown function (DUF4439)